MFNCQFCSKSIGPRVPLSLVVTLVRDRAYTFSRFDEEEKESIGSSVGNEVVEEKRICPSCSGLTIEVNKPLVDPMPRFQSFGSIALEGLLERTKHNTLRSKKDFEAGYPIFKNFELAGGGI